MASKFLLRTNPALTTNIKLLVSSEYKLYLESYDANDILSNVKYKHVPIQDSSYLSEHVPAFYKELPSDVAFQVKQNKASDTPITNYSEQIDDTYSAGADFVEDTWHKEEFEFVAPLYVDAKNLPSNFIVMRVDGAGAYNLQAQESATEKGFREEIVNKWKCVKLFDLTSESPIGRFLTKNYTDNPNLPQAPFELNLKKFQFSKWNGIEYKSGGYCSKSFFLDETLRSEMTHFDLEEFVTTGFQRNNVIAHNILNIKFLFDDTPGIVLPNRLTERRKWSINRYIGFYLNNMEVVKEPSPYYLESLKTVKIVDNVFLDSNDNYIDPFVNGFSEKKNMFVKYGDKFLQVQKNGSSYVVIDEVLHNAADASTYFNCTASIVFKTVGETSVMEYSNGTQFTLSHVDSNDLHLIEIDGTYHVLTFDINNNCVINSDYSIVTDNKYIYQNVAGTTLPNVEFTKEEKPITFKIYKVAFTDIEDLDFERINTKYTHYEYEKPNEVNNTLEPKLYVKDKLEDGYYSEDGYQLSVDNVKYPESGDFYIPSASEYASDESLWMLKNDLLTAIWDKNQWVSKWGFAKSLSHADYPYKLNNSFSVGGLHNRVPAFNISVPNREYCNLDWFYTIGVPREVTSATQLSVAVDNPSRYIQTVYNHYSLDINHHLPFPEGSTAAGWDFWNTSYFDIDTYTDPESPYDYFEWFFTQADTFNTKKRNVKKYAKFTPSDDVNAPQCLFRGMNVKIFDTVTVSPSQTDGITYKLNKEYDGYKFSSVFSKRPTADTSLYGKSGIEIYCNKKWKNVLVYIYLYTPYNSLTNFEATVRDTFYTTERFAYNFNIQGATAYESNSVETPLTPDKLTLFNFVNGVNDMNYDTGFTNGIVYNVIEDTSFKSVLAISKNDAENTLDFILDEDVAYKEGDYVSLVSCDVAIATVNTPLDGVYVIKKVSGNTVTLAFGGVAGMTITADMGKIADATPDLPFRINISLPDSITVNTTAYDITAEKVDIEPVNNLSNVGSVLTVKDSSNLIPSVYNKQPQARRITKKNASVNDFQIYRFSGLYEPISAPVELFYPIHFTEADTIVDAHNAANTFEADTEKFKIDFGTTHDYIVGDYVLVTVAQGSLSAANKLVRNRIYKVIAIADNHILVDKDVTTATSSLTVAGVYVYKLNLIQKNTKFDTTLANFGIVRQIISKANPEGLPMKTTAKNSALKSVYPMVDEHGVAVVNSFIFKSSWDDEFYYQCIQNRF